MSAAVAHPLVLRFRTMVLAGGRPLRFAAAGAVNTLFGLAFYPVLLWASAPLREHYLIALVIAQLSCLVFAYFVYKLTVFRARGNSLREFGTFSSFYVISSGVNWIALPLMVEHGGIPPAIAQTGFSLLLMIGSYFWHSRLTFRPTTRDL